MKIKERLAKSKARIQAYYNIDLESEEERERLQPKPLEGSYWRRSIMMDDTSIVGEFSWSKKGDLSFLIKVKICNTGIRRICETKWMNQTCLIEQRRKI